MEKKGIMQLRPCLFIYFFFISHGVKILSHHNRSHSGVPCNYKGKKNVLCAQTKTLFDIQPQAVK